MSLKKRLLTILLLSGFILALLFHFSINATIVPDLKKQKEIFVGKIKKKLRRAFDLEEKRVRELCDNWSGWDELINYIKKPSSHFEEGFLAISPFSSHKLNMVLILDPEDNRLFNKNCTKDVNAIPFNRLKIETIIDKIVKKVRGDGQIFEGIVRSDYGPVILAVNSVELDMGRRGILVLGRLVNQTLLNEMSFHFIDPLQLISFKETQLFTSSLKQMEGETNKKITIF